MASNIRWVLERNKNGTHVSHQSILYASPVQKFGRGSAPDCPVILADLTNFSWFCLLHLLKLREFNNNLADLLYTRTGSARLRSLKRS